PSLTGLAENVGRHTCDRGWLQVVVELEKFRMAPDIDAVVVDKDGHVTQDADATPRAVSVQRTPLLEKHKLNNPLDLQFPPMLRLEAIESLRFATCELARPGAPSGALVRLADYFKKHKIFQPPAARPLELGKARASSLVFEKPLRRLAK